jgi:hypothetical protein
VWWYTPIILERLRQEDWKFEGSLDTQRDPISKEKTINK